LKLLKDIEEYMSHITESIEPKKVDRPKIIYDAVFGTHELTELEVNIIDLPLVQRLRGIHQTGLASFVFPSATHTRFEHSLGVSIIANKMGVSLKDKIERSDVYEMRLAGLLHDIGHGPFSHLCDEIFFQLDDVKEVQNADSRFSPSKPHEMIGYFMLNSSSFKDYFEDKLNSIYSTSNFSLQNISEMIIGSMEDSFNFQYKSDVINGPFDSDKLDYLVRDAYFTGIKLAIDIDRILATQILEERPGHRKRIIGGMGGVHVLEQVLFSKMLLFPSIYHHHKVRSSDCMIKSIFEIINDNELEINNLKFEKVSNFLLIDDNFFLSEKGKPDPVANQIIKNKKRQLLKRALVISRNTLKTEDNFENLLELVDEPQELREIAKEIAEHPDIKGKCEYYDIWIDVPRSPRFPEPSQYLVKLTEDVYKPLSDFFPISEWSNSYEINKWKGFVFGPANLQKTVSDISLETLEKVLGIEFNDQAKILAKHASVAS